MFTLVDRFLKKMLKEESNSPFFIVFCQGSWLQYECYNGDNDEDYYEPPCDIHGKPCYTAGTQYIGNQRQYKKKNSQFNNHFSSPIFFIF